jgi:hypothetical protein
MKRKTVLISSLAILMLFGIIAPVVASPPEMGTFTLGVLEFATDPGEQFLTGNILHGRNSVGESVFSTLPWGTPTTASETVIRYEVDITTGIGSSTSETVDVYPNGIVVGTVQTDLAGVGYWVYPGPNLTFNDESITTGQTFFGLYTNIMAVKHGISGELKGLVTKEIATGVTLLSYPDLEPLGIAVAYATGTYTLK